MHILDSSIHRIAESLAASNCHAAKHAVGLVAFPKTSNVTSPGHAGHSDDDENYSVLSAGPDGSSGGSPPRTPLLPPLSPHSTPARLRSGRHTAQLSPQPTPARPLPRHIPGVTQITPRITSLTMCVMISLNHFPCLRCKMKAFKTRFWRCNAAAAHGWQRVACGTRLCGRREHAPAVCPLLDDAKMFL